MESEPIECFCPILGRPTLVDETDLGRDAWKIVRCRETDFVFLANPPEYEQLESNFAWERTMDAEATRRRSEQSVTARISGIVKAVKQTGFGRRNKFASLSRDLLKRRATNEPANLLDIGCGCGHLMMDIHRGLTSRGYKIVPWGIEVSSKLASMAKWRFAESGGDVHATNALDGIDRIEAGSIHVAILASFLEHESRPLELLERMHGILAPGAAVVLKVPNFACWNRKLRGTHWCGFRFPDHVNYFTPRTLRILAETAGFTIERQTVLDALPLSDNMYAVLRSTKSATLQRVA